MNRRQFLGGLGAGTAAWIAGCIDGGSSEARDGEADSGDGESDERQYAGPDDPGPEEEGPLDPSSLRRLDWADETPRSAGGDIESGVDVLCLVDEDRLRCLRHDGTPQWQAPVESPTARVSASNRVLVHDDGTLLARNGDEGSVEWSVDFEAGTRPAMDPESTSFGVVAATDREVLLCEDGAVQWRQSLPEDTQDVASFSDPEERVVYVTDGGRFQPIDVPSGEAGRAFGVTSDAGGPWTITRDGSDVVALDGAGTVYVGDFNGIHMTLRPPDGRSLAGRPRVSGHWNGWITLYPTLPADFDDDGTIGHALRVDVTANFGGGREWSTTLTPWRDAGSTWTGRVESSSDVLGDPSAFDGIVFLPLGDRVLAFSEREGSRLGTFDPFGSRTTATASTPPKIEEVVRSDGGYAVDSTAGVFRLLPVEEGCDDVALREVIASESDSGTEIETSLAAGPCQTIVAVEVVGDDVVLAEPFRIRSNAEADPSAGVLAAGETADVVLRTESLERNASELSVRVRGTWGDQLDEVPVSTDEARS